MIQQRNGFLSFGLTTQQWFREFAADRIGFNLIAYALMEAAFDKR